MVWVVVTAVGLVAEISGIIALGQHMTGRDDASADLVLVAGTSRRLLLSGAAPGHPAPSELAPGAGREPANVVSTGFGESAGAGRLRQEEHT